jgi:hypothetical protein
VPVAPCSARRKPPGTRRSGPRQAKTPRGRRLRGFVQRGTRRDPARDHQGPGQRRSRGRAVRDVGCPPAAVRTARDRTVQGRCLPAACGSDNPAIVRGGRGGGDAGACPAPGNGARGRGRPPERSPLPPETSPARCRAGRAAASFRRTRRRRCCARRAPSVGSLGLGPARTEGRMAAAAACPAPARSSGGAHRPWGRPAIAAAPPLPVRTPPGAAAQRARSPGDRRGSVGTRRGTHRGFGTAGKHDL